MAKNKIKSGFVQIPYNVIARTTPPEERVYIVIRHFETMEKGCICSVDTIGKEAGFCERQIRRILSSLENKGLIKRNSRPGITTKYTTTDPEGEKEAPEEKTPEQTPEEMAQNPGQNCPPSPRTKLSPHPGQNCPPNNIEKNNIETEHHKQNIENTRKRAHAHTQKKKMIAFLDFCVTGNKKTKGSTPLHRDAPDKLYTAALSIGYTMTVQEVYTFLETMYRGVAIKKKQGFYHVDNFERLLFSWRDNQTAEKERQAQSERKRLADGDIIPFMCFNESFNRCSPFTEERERHCLLDRCASLKFNFPCQNRFWRYETGLYDELPENQRKKIFNTLRYIPRDVTPDEFLSKDSEYYWKNFIDNRGKIKRERRTENIS